MATATMAGEGRPMTDASLRILAHRAVRIAAGLAIACLVLHVGFLVVAFSVFALLMFGLAVACALCAREAWRTPESGKARWSMAFLGIAMVAVHLGGMHLGMMGADHHSSATGGQMAGHMMAGHAHETLSATDVFMHGGVSLAVAELVLLGAAALLDVRRRRSVSRT